jgi:DNA-binding transcriptional MocR family regulator
MDRLALTLDPQSDRALYLQLGDALAAAVAVGDLHPGERLPSERDLADQLGLSRTTVVNAYRELASRGLVRGHVGRGTFICADPTPTDAPFAWRGKVALGAQRTLDQTLRTLVVSPPNADTISFAAGLTALDQFPLDTYRALSDAILARNANALGLGPSEGQPALRRALAARLGVRLEQVLILAGAQQGIDIVARCLLDPGDTVVMDRPGYLGAIQIFRATGASVVGWRSEEGALDELEDLILRYRPKLIYTNATFQNPTGAVLPLATRRDLLELAARYHLPILEDEPYRDLYYSTPPPPALRELDEHGLVIGLGTFSKTFAPGLRLGWLAAPEPIVDQLALIKGRSDVFCAGLPQLVMAEFLISRRYDEHLQRLRGELSRRHRAMLTALDEFTPPGMITTRPVNGGLYLWARLGHGVATHDLLPVAQRLGVRFVDGERFYADGAGRHDMRLCFTGVPPARIPEGVRRLAAAIAEVQAQPPTEAGHEPLV